MALDYTIIAPTEAEIQKSILEYLQKKNYFCWRNNTGARQFDYQRKGDGKVTRNFFQWGKPGSGDILGLRKDGRFFSIEVKRKGKKPSADQIEFMRRVNETGGEAFVAESLDDVINHNF